MSGLRFKKGQRILCLPGSLGDELLLDSPKQWRPAIIEAVNYRNYDTRKMVSKVVAYKVRFLMPLPRWNAPENPIRFGYLETDDEEMCVELTPENFVRYDELNILGQYYDKVFLPMLLKIKDDKEEVERLMMLAASLRRIRSLEVIARVCQMESILKEYKSYGQKLLFRAIHADEQYTFFPDSNEINHRYVIAHVENFEMLINWLGDVCNTQVEMFTDEHGRHVEHIAVLRGDFVLLKWLLWERWEYARVPQFRDAGRASRLHCSAVDSSRSNSDVEATGMPVDAYGWSPLHYLLFCYSDGNINSHKGEVSVAEKINLLMHFYYSIHYVSVGDWDLKTPEGFTALDLVRNKDLRSNQLEKFGLSLTHCRGKYGLVPSEKEMMETVIRCREFQHFIYQETVYDAIHGDLERNYDYVKIQSLIEKHNLDVRPRDWEGWRIETHFFAFKAASLSYYKRFRWLFEVLKFADLNSTDESGQNLMHVAAHFNQHLRDTQARMSIQTNEHRILRRAQRNVEKFQIIRSYKGNTCYTTPDSWFAERESSFARRGMCEDIKHLLQGKECRLEMVDMLYGYGMPLPTTRFCIHECDFPTAKLLLQKKNNYNRFIESHFLDSAPVAMALTKEYLYETNVGEMHETMAGMAILCLEKHPWDVEDLLEFSRLLLFQWLIEEEKVINALSYRSRRGETLLHLAIRNRQVLAVFWLCVNYGALCRVHEGIKGQLPAHLALEMADDYDTSSLILQAVIKFTGDYRSQASFLDGWDRDIRVWDLKDGRGVSLLEYAKTCKNSSVKQALFKNGMKKVFSEAVAQLESCSIGSEENPFCRPLCQKQSSSDFWY